MEGLLKSCFQLHRSCIPPILQNAGKINDTTKSLSNLLSSLSHLICDCSRPSVTTPASTMLNRKSRTKTVSLIALSSVRQKSYWILQSIQTHDFRNKNFNITAFDFMFCGFTDNVC